jgi:hypothetical protein
MSIALLHLRLKHAIEAIEAIDIIEAIEAIEAVELIVPEREDHEQFNWTAAVLEASQFILSSQ